MSLIFMVNTKIGTALTISILVLLLIIAGELFFYFTISNKTITPTKLVPAPSPGPFTYEPEILETVRNHIIDEENKVSVQFDDIGTVDEVSQNYSDSYNRTAELYIAIAHKSKPQDPNKNIRISKYFLSKKNITIYIILKDGQKKEASITDIKKGDKIDIKDIINIVDIKTKNYTFSYVIEIIK